MKKLSAAIAAGLQALPRVVLAHVPDEGYPAGPGVMMWRHGAGWWIIPLVMFVIMIIFCFRFMGRRRGRSSWCGWDERKDAETPLDILKRRYAKGDINKEEFETIKKDL